MFSSIADAVFYFMENSLYKDMKLISSFDSIKENL